MYNLPYFKEADRQKLIDFMKENYFAVLTGFDGEYPVATQIPLEVEIDGTDILLKGHMMKASDHCKAFEKYPDVLVIFPGPHTYVSASWYSKPGIASTWNYMTVQAKGRIIFGDEKDTYEAVKKITEKHEGESKAKFSSLPADYVSQMVKAIVSFEILVASIENVFKLSQNRDTESKANIITELMKKGTDNAVAIAKAMREKYEL